MIAKGALALLREEVPVRSLRALEASRALPEAPWAAHRGTAEAPTLAAPPAKATQRTTAEVSFQTQVQAAPEATPFRSAKARGTRPFRSRSPNRCRTRTSPAPRLTSACIFRPRATA